MDLRSEFVALAKTEGCNIRMLCRHYGIAPATGYKWLHRDALGGSAELADRSRRPRHSPAQTAPSIEAAVVALRDEHPSWGGRKLAARLQALGWTQVPSPSTITTILRRNDRLAPPERVVHAWQRFEHAAANQLWQMDFKGHVPLGQGQGRLHPLTVLDDHSRFCVVLGACANEQTATVQAQLIGAFRRYGLPDRMLMDNGSPWGDTAAHPWTPLGVWLLRLGVAVSHGRAYHPQTQGKEERFHRTLKAEVLQGPAYGDCMRAQAAFDRWRTVYNLERPHEACALQPPISRYRASSRPYPEALPSLDYAPDLLVRRVQAAGALWLHGRQYRLSDAFRGQPVALQPAAEAGLWTVYFSRFPIGRIDERVHVQG